MRDSGWIGILLVFVARRMEFLPLCNGLLSRLFRRQHVECCESRAGVDKSAALLILLCLNKLSDLLQGIRFDVGNFALNGIL